MAVEAESIGLGLKEREARIPVAVTTIVGLFVGLLSSVIGSILRFI